MSERQSVTQDTVPASGPPSVTLTMEQLRELIQAAKPSQADQLALIEAQAQANAKANQQALRPENTTHPGKSAFSYPEGDVARPRPPFKCRMFWMGDERDYNNTTAEELELLNQLEPGDFICTKADGTKMAVKVEGQWDPATSRVSQFDVRFGDKDNVRTQPDMLREMLAQQAARKAGASKVA